ncbi:MAG TPA: GntR family transcriptional regulator [Sphingopyxis sp.]|nr:GntR family transcriptional regulator [Sphingopyxis sp.]HMP44724.1 GntR family transcriptional regulator [Sphingopyxis sp.]HMQ17719.1 GntR family transcriptional regulator [Sphingopyxis sp.]
MTSLGDHSRRGRELAARIIAQVVADALPAGSMLGTEPELMARFSVSRGTFREAVRQLEWQGVVTAARGAGGGLRVAAPGIFVPMFALKVYFELARVDPVAMRRALRIVHRAIVESGVDAPDGILEFMARAADGQFAAAIDRTRERGARESKLSERTAYAITLEIEDRDMRPGDAIGREPELLERLNVGRGVLREALNLMEINGVIEVRRGTRGGIFVGTPTADFAIDAACVHLAIASSASAVAAAQRGLFLANGDKGFPAGTRAPSPDALAVAARTAANRERNPVLAIFLRVFERYWRDFHPGEPVKAK